MPDSASRSFTDVSTAFPVVPESAASARRYVAAAFQRFAPDDDRAESAVQLASEVVAWAYRHGVAPIRLTVAAPDPAAVTVRMTVRHERPLIEIDPTMAQLFDHIASEWSVRSDVETTTIRFVMRVDEPDESVAGGD